MSDTLTPNEERWCDWLPTLAPHEQVTHDQANWTSCMAFCGGIESESSRLRPLLAKCEALVRAQLHLNQRLRWPDGEAGALLRDLLADLRRELGPEGKG